MASDMGLAVAYFVQVGFVCRPVEETIRDTWEWMQGQDGPALAPKGIPVGGLTAEKEASLRTDI